MNQITKKQHYVPRCLLRHFASNDKVSVFDSEREAVRHNRHIKEEFAENYLYDTDNAVENLLAKIEDNVAPLIARYAEGSIDNSSKMSPELARFVAVQLARTPGARSEMLDLVDKFTSRLIQQIGELNDLQTENIKLELKNPNVILVRHVLDAIVFLWHLVADLRPHLLVNKTSVPFVLSDHPIVHYNWYLKDSADPEKTGIPAAGIQIFLPISNKVTLCLYDSKVYKIGERDQPSTELGNDLDIELLNSLQAMNRERLVVFGDISSETYVRRLCCANARMSLHVGESKASEPVPTGKDNLSSSLEVWRTQRAVNSWLSVVKIRRDARRNRGEFRYRQPEVVARIDMARERLKRE